MWNWLKKLFKIGVVAYEVKNPDPLTKAALDIVETAVDAIGKEKEETE